ncbi:hypothetical protein PTSG_02740 [Salpingoeca rosetta]|uniref:Charged multivesicular body protein 2a n=1 Tax=Salpingoeca rosetta (strain ATCC 50818 / BSB-021) TaxID=946362 RepID=F2U365_SALR5|nr:uncharacterized protein PTSG_02740 [Salpingoeca rosetta]EGD82059.1 hypothetical protein PTSG_02740 [Salpingoeca rosetta]|eukprot:XP_004996242.1 hypothetical protein PTSG_02740 [Salpingoeca rosetta]
MPRGGDPKKQLRSHQRELRQGERELQREIARLDREEQKLQQQIKAAAKKGDEYTAKALAKQLVQLRKSRTRQYQAKGNLASVRSQASTMQATATMAKSMGTAAKTMQAMNAHVSPQEIAKIMGQFEEQTTKMEMGQEIMEDALDAAFDDSDMEDETEGLVNQVLDEVGLDVSSAMSSVPSASMPAKTTKVDQATKDEQDLLARLASLK